MSRRRARVLLLAVAVLALSLGGCGAAGTSSRPVASAPYRAMMRQELAGKLGFHPSAFEKKVFADGYVSAEEYHQGQQLYTKCMADAGYVVDQWKPDGGANIHAAPNSSDQKLKHASEEDGRCQQGTLMIVSQIYVGEKYNPLDLSTDQEIQACYKKHKVPDGESLSDKEFSSFIHADAYRPSSPVADLCFLDPDGEEGLTQKEAVEQMRTQISTKDETVTVR